jgi:hypothetical protein
MLSENTGGPVAWAWWYHLIVYVFGRGAAELLWAATHKEGWARKSCSSPRRAGVGAFAARYAQRSTLRGVRDPQSHRYSQRLARVSEAPEGEYQTDEEDAHSSSASAHSNNIPPRPRRSSA